jgi:16S rRNA (cytidine1402-2'-O)-methyltransferase
MSGDEAISSGGVAVSAAAEVQRHLGEPLAPGLYLVATPIGNLGDVTLRALSVLARADIVLCEDTRHSRTLLSHFGIAPTTRPYHEHNAERERPRVLADLEAGRRVALISDAGTPLVSDPGYKLVRSAIDVGHRVEALPGPSAALAALSVAGLPTDTFFFAGFLPPKSAARRARLSELKGVPATLVFFEAPSRVAETLADLAALLGDRPAALARELTKLHEQVRRGPLAVLAAEISEAGVKGEAVIVVGAPRREEIADADIRARLDLALQSMSLRDAAKAVAEALGVPKSRVYDLGLRTARKDE